MVNLLDLFLLIWGVSIVAVAVLGFSALRVRSDDNNDQDQKVINTPRLERAEPMEQVSHREDSADDVDGASSGMTRGVTAAAVAAGISARQSSRSMCFTEPA